MNFVLRHNIGAYLEFAKTLRFRACNKQQDLGNQASANFVAQDVFTNIN